MTALLDRFAANAPPIAWAPSMRDQGRTAFVDTGLPTPKWEAWKYTNLARRLHAGYVAASDEPPAALPLGVPDIDAYRVVLTNGRYCAALSKLDGLPDGVILTNLAQAVDDGRDELRQRLGALASTDGAPFTALNLAGFADGLYLEIAEDVSLDRPIHLVELTGGGPHACHPRHVITLAPGASATLVQTRIGLGDGGDLSNTVGEVQIGAGASLHHLLLQREGVGAVDIARMHAELDEGARYDRLTVQLGAGLSRQEVQVRLSAPHATCRLAGAYLALDRGHVDNTNFIDHAAPDTTSQQVFKGVLGGRARAVFQGRTRVCRHAQRADGHQLSRALLLSPDAEIDAKPELEIYADDVKCSHGATAGALDDEALFYLRTRGIDRASARRLLVEAFLIELVDTAPHAEMGEATAAALRERLGALGDA